MNDVTQNYDVVAKKLEFNGHNVDVISGLIKFVFFFGFFFLELLPLEHLLFHPAEY